MIFLIGIIDHSYPKTPKEWNDLGFKLAFFHPFGIRCVTTIPIRPSGDRDGRVHRVVLVSG